MGEKKNPIEKTWPNLKTHFARAFKEARQKRETLQTSGYSAHLQNMQSRNQANAALFTKLQQDQNEALANLATTARVDRESVSLMSRTISELTTQIANITKQLSEAYIEIARLQGTPPKTGGGGLTAHRLADKMISKSCKRFDPMRYCWSHGYKVKEGHNSCTCRQPKPNHDKTATRLETKGGKQWNKDWTDGGPTK